MAHDAAPPKSGMRSLYANLLGDSSASTPGTISSAPVTYKQTADSTPEQDEAAKKQQALAATASLHFQPTKRPNLQAQKAKAKAIAAKFAPPPSATSTSTTTPATNTEKTEAASATQAPVPRTTLADWTGDGDVDFYPGERRERGGRKKRKKNKGVEEIPQNWDDIYDPSRPNNYEEYKNSDEKVREIREWKDRLYAHQIRRRETSDDESEDEDRRPIRQFAPPPMSFAPPKFDEDYQPPPPPPPVDVPDDPTGDDAYARRLRLSQQQSTQPPQPPQPPSVTEPPPPPPTGQISRAPVRYNLPPPPDDIPASEAELEAALASDSPSQSGATTPSVEDADAPRSKRPGQAGFAERLMSKYGWTKGSGLGASGTGIVNPLYAKVDKRKKKPDAEGGGFATPAGHGKILGGHKDAKGKAESEGKFGKMSEVIKLAGMLRGLDVDEELTGGGGGGGLMQEIGEECAEKYGNVERVYIHRGGDDNNTSGPSVFVKFTSQLSALRAVNALEGRVFSGNQITARFWEREAFDEGRYE